MTVRDLALNGIIKAAASMSGYGVPAETSGHYVPPTPTEFNKSLKAKKLPKLGWKDRGKLLVYDRWYNAEDKGKTIIQHFLDSPDVSGAARTNRGASSPLNASGAPPLAQHIMAREDFASSIYAYLKKHPEQLAPVAAKYVKNKGAWYSDALAPVVRTFGNTGVGRDMLRPQIDKRLIPKVNGETFYYQQLPNYNWETAQ